MTGSHMLLSFVYTPHIAVQQQHVHTVKQTLTQSVWFPLGVCVIKNTIKYEVWLTVCIDCAKSLFPSYISFFAFFCMESGFKVTCEQHTVTRTPHHPENISFGQVEKAHDKS